MNCNISDNEKNLIILSLKDLRHFYSDLTQNTVIKDDVELKTYYSGKIADINKLIEKLKKGE